MLNEDMLQHLELQLVPHRVDSAIDFGRLMGQQSCEAYEEIKLGKQVRDTNI